FASLTGSNVPIRNRLKPQSARLSPVARYDESGPIIRRGARANRALLTAYYALRAGFHERFMGRVILAQHGKLCLSQCLEFAELSLKQILVELAHERLS